MYACMWHAMLFSIIIIVIFKKNLIFLERNLRNVVLNV